MIALALLAAAACPAAAQTANPEPPAAAAAPPPPDSVTGTAAWDRLKGNTITGKASGQTFSEFFDPAGGVRYVDKDGLSTGTWTLQSAKVCFDFPEDDDRSCSTFTIKGAAGFSVDDDGETMHFSIEPGNSKGL